MSVTIDQCAKAGACKSGLRWAREQNWPGGVVDMDALRGRDLGWFYWVVWCVAGPELLTELAGDANWCVRDAVAQNRNCPVEVLTKLAGDADPCVRRGLARHPKCTVGLLTKLAGDADWWVRYDVAGCPKCPVELLTKLAGEAHWCVREAAQRRLKAVRE